MRPPSAKCTYRPGSATTPTSTSASAMPRTSASCSRPDNPLLPNYKHVPIGYHGRASTARVSGSEVRRPNGQTLPAGASEPVFGPCARLDYELELGIWIGQGNALGEAIPVSRAAEHSPASVCSTTGRRATSRPGNTSRSARSCRRASSPAFRPGWSPPKPWSRSAAPSQRPEGDPRPLPYLYDDNDQAHGAFDIELEVLLLTEGLREGLPPQRLTLSNSLSMYWTGGADGRPPQRQWLPVAARRPVRLRHPVRRRARPVRLAAGDHRWRQAASATGLRRDRRFLEDGDEVILRARCKREGHVSIGFGECRGKVLAAHPGRADEALYLLPFHLLLPRIALALKGLDYQSLPVNLVRDGGEHRQPAYLALTRRAAYRPCRSTRASC